MEESSNSPKNERRSWNCSHGFNAGTRRVIHYFFSCDPRLTHLCMPQRECANVPLETVVRSDGVRIRSAYRGITSIIEKCIRIENSIEASMQSAKKKFLDVAFLAKEGNKQEPEAFSVGRDLPLNRRQLVTPYLLV